MIIKRPFAPVPRERTQRAAAAPPERPAARRSPVERGLDGRRRRGWGWRRGPAPFPPPHPCLPPPGGKEKNAPQWPRENICG